MQFDLIVEQADIYDGTGRRAYRADVGVKGEKITEIGRLSDAEADRRINARGLALSPGFIDVHSHADFTIVREDHSKRLEPLVRQGITTFVGGNCGVSFAPIGEENRDFAMAFFDMFIGEDPEPIIHWSGFGEMLDAVEKQGSLLNFAVLAPHGILRMNAMGSSRELASRRDLKHMKKQLSQCLEEGAVGMSTGLQYFPGSQSDTRELIELGHTINRYGGVFTSHLRSYNSDTLGKAVDEVFTVCREAEVPVQMSHMFWVPNFPWPLNRVMDGIVALGSDFYNRLPVDVPLDTGLRPILDLTAKRIGEGYPIGMDAMPTSAGFTHLIAFFPPWVLDGKREEITERIRDPQTRKKILHDIETGDSKWPHREGNSWSMNFFKVMGWSSVFVMSVISEKNQSLIGKNFVEIGKEQGKHPFDAVCDLLLEEDGRVLIFETATRPGDPFIELSLKGTLIDPNVSIVTDTILIGYGRPSHIYYDCFPKFLRNYGLSGKGIPLREAIRKCTSLPAKQLQIKNRGKIEKGYFADLVLFDPKTIRSNSTAEAPDRDPDGIELVAINGKVVLDENGFHDEKLHGQVIRR